MLSNVQFFFNYWGRKSREFDIFARAWKFEVYILLVRCGVMSYKTLVKSRSGNYLQCKLRLHFVVPAVVASKVFISDNFVF